MFLEFTSTNNFCYHQHIYVQAFYAKYYFIVCPYKNNIIHFSTSAGNAASAPVLEIAFFTLKTVWKIRIFRTLLQKINK